MYLLHVAVIAAEVLKAEAIGEGAVCRFANRQLQLMPGIANHRSFICQKCGV